MTTSNQAPEPILIAIPDEWQGELTALLTQRGFSVIVATTQQEAVEIIENQAVRGVITVQSWGMDSEDGKTTGLIQIIKGKIPSVTLIKKSGNYRWFDEVFEPPMHEYCTVPVDLDGLLSFMRRAKMIS